jgi:SsrA-binding protein
MSDYAFNRQAVFDYLILEKFEAGLKLTGQEVKSIRTGQISLKSAFVVIQGEEAWLLNASISPYQPHNTPAGYNPTRSRKLLLHKAEIRSLIGKTKQVGLTLVPLRVYNLKGKIKLEFALCRGKKQYDKREQINRRETDRQIERALRGKIE